MKKPQLLILLLFALLTLAAAAWQACEAYGLEDKLQAIDREAQAQRLLELSLPRVEAASRRLLEEEVGKQGLGPELNRPDYPMPEGGQASFNKGFFFLSPAGLMLPEENAELAQEMQHDAALMDTLTRKADNPDAPLMDPNEPVKARAAGSMPVFGIFQVKETDFSKPMEMDGEAGDVFYWPYKGMIYCMRRIPTSHGNGLEGFVLDPKELAQELMALVEPGLKAARIEICPRGEKANLAPLPLILRAGNEVELPDSSARREALRASIHSSLALSLLSIALLLGLLIFYARVEKRRRDFVSAVTHELRTPLTSFKLYTEMLKDGQVPPEKLQGYYDNLHRESLRLGHLVENVLAFSRLSRGKLRGRQDSGSCAALLGELFQRLGERLKQRGVQFTQTIDSRCALLSLRTDIVSVEQILTNLTDNAVKYAGSKHPAISISAAQGHRKVCIRVTDNGIGIAPEQRRLLFRPFSRSAEAVSGRKPGIGLGLALSLDLARAIGGDLELESSSERGSCFILSLPLGE